MTAQRTPKEIPQGAPSTESRRTQSVVHAALPLVILLGVVLMLILGAGAMVMMG